MHIRLQSWFPFTVQVYLHGREWLGRQLDQQGIAYERYENAFLHVADLAAARALGERSAKFNPVAAADCAHFAAVMAGDHLLNGFGNHDLATRLNETSNGSSPTRRRHVPRSPV